MRSAPFILVLIGAISLLSLNACVSGKPKTPSYTDSSGATQLVQTDAEACRSACDEEYVRCGETDAAQRKSVDASGGLFGAKAGCKTALSACTINCKGR